MHSIFRLCDYGIPYNTVLRLKDNNITCNSIINNPDCLNTVLGTRSKRAKEIKNIIHDLVNSEQKFSIYDLMYFGLSKTITELLVNNDISIDDINDSLIHKDFIGDSTFRKIMKSYNEFIMNNNIKLKLTSELLLSLIKNIYSYEAFNYEQLAEEVAKCNYEVLDLSILLENFLNKKILKKEDSNYSLVKPRLKEELDKIKDQNHKDIILKKLTGRTLESIGSEYNVTRERIRQIIQKEIKKFVITREEEKYKEIFETYNFDCDLFCEFFNVNDYVYYYLREKYKMGDTEPSELIDSWNLDKRQLAILKRKYNLISYKGENIVVKKINILNAILKQSEKAMEYSEIMSEYNKIIEINNLDIDLISEADFRNIDSILNRSNYVLCDVGRYYRYYDIDALDEEDVNALQKMLDVEPGDYSSEFFFNSNELLMKNIDIKNEYELHNLLRKYIGNYNGKITYSRMPDIFIDCDDKNAFVDNLIHELSPISLDEFVDYVYQNYGHKNNTFRALLVSNFSKYITNGQIISECPEFTEEQMNILNEKLTEDIYSIITIKELLTDLFDVNDFKLINNLNMSKLGYKLRGNYIMKSSISNLEGYLRNIILNSDYYEIKPEMKKIGSTFSSYLYKFIYNLDLFEIDNEKYITIKKLNELGISKENIKEFINEIEKVISDNEYFNLYTLDKDNFLTNLKQYNFPDCFYETIISAIPNVKTFTVKNNVVFIKTDEQATREKFINSFVTKNKIFVSEIKKDILTKYNIDLYEYYIKEFIDKKKFYFDNSIDCVYKSKDYYDEDINELDILSLID